MESCPQHTSKPPCASSILVVDDEAACSELVATLLRSQGYSVRGVSDGREALGIVANGGVDLLLLDLMMSNLDGVEVCAHVRNELHDLFLPIIITTSLGDRESRIRAKEAGADDVLVKPIDGLELLVRMESLLRARAALVQLERERDRALEALGALNAQRELGRKSRTRSDVEPVSTGTGTLPRMAGSADTAEPLDARGPATGARK